MSSRKGGQCMMKACFLTAIETDEFPGVAVVEVLHMAAVKYLEWLASCQRNRLRMSIRFFVAIYLK